MYDFIIVGAGIIGASTAMHLQQRFPDRNILLLEKESAAAQHQTGRNSGVIHAGVYYPPGSLKADFCRRGNQATKAFCERWHIPYRECGKLIVATNDLELGRLRQLWRRSGENAIERSWLDQAELQHYEANISGVAAIRVPSSAVVDYAEITEKMLALFRQGGGETVFDHEVTAINETSTHITLQSAQRNYKSRYLLCCGGLMADRLAKMAGLPTDFSICPFRGEYYRLNEQHSDIVSHMIYPVPEPGMPFLGVHLTPMINGGISIGPNAVLAWQREGYRRGSFSLRDSISMLSQAGVSKLLGRHVRSGVRELRNSWLKKYYLREVNRYCPSLTSSDLRPHPSGVRAQAVSHSGELIDDFLFLQSQRSIHVCNAPSPAATSAIPIGEYITEKIQRALV